jgi:hypothetical protein
MKDFRVQPSSTRGIRRASWRAERGGLVCESFGTTYVVKVEMHDMKSVVLVPDVNLLLPTSSVGTLWISRLWY